ncbi:MAG TPA: acyl-phosphate glycerol 3-phosphate acyltransferase [Gammaproteobacteria bacterium]|nr:acyl-phosphate glycerol 3-phosphate acyltransferase [Gammaproteobacteria bacterium]
MSREPKLASIYFYLTVVGAYLIGSVSSAILICQIFGLGDPRLEGSKNPGTTNVLRLGGRGPAILTLVSDVAKGALPVGIGISLNFSGIELGWIALAAFLGHLYPIFFKFAGGKGVATAIGALLIMNPVLAVTLVIVWIGVAVSTGYSSLSALIAAFLAPTAAYYLAEPSWPICLIMSAFLFWRHRQNIQNLMNGTESKISLSKKT